MWYRFTHRRGIKHDTSFVELCRKTTTDGERWSEREVLIDLLHSSTGQQFSNMVVSPAILHQEGKYRMWYVNSEADIQREVHLSSSSDASIWDDIQHCKLIGPTINPWHIDVNYIDGKYYLVCYDHDITLWESANGVDFVYKKQLVNLGVLGCFYWSELYRAVLIKDNSYKLYFSAADSFKTYIGLMEGDRVDNMVVKLLENKEYRSFGNMLGFVYKYEKGRIFFIIKNTMRNFIRKVKK